MTDRILAIQTMLQRSPQDVFLHYSLAMELAGQGRFDEAAAEFARCTELDPEYLAAYVEGGKALRGARNLRAAKERFGQALEVALRQGNIHMQDFVRQQLEALGD